MKNKLKAKFFSYLKIKIKKFWGIINLKCSKLSKNINYFLNRIKEFYNKLIYKVNRLNLESKILSSGVLLTMLLIILINVPIFNKLFILDNQDFAQILSTNAKIIATIFAITISLTLLGFQYLSQNISPKILYSFFKLKFISYMIVLYAFSILFNIFSLLFYKTKLSVNISFLLLILCIMYLISYLYFMISNLQPQKIIQHIEKNISSVSYNDDNYTILEQIIIKSIRNNDFFSFLTSIKIIFNKQNYFLEKLLKKEINQNYGYDSRHSDTEQIVYYFLRIENQIYFEIMKERNERFLLHYLDNLKDLHIILLKLMAIRPYREIRDHFNDISYDIIELKLKGVYDFYCRLLEKISKEEFNSIPSGNMFLEFQDKMEEYSKLSENEKEIQTLKHIIYDYFQYDRLKNLVDLSKLASDKNLNIFVLSIKGMLSDLLDSAMLKNDNKKMQYWLVRSILESLKIIHSYSIDKDIETSYFGFLSLHYKVDTLKDEKTINTLGLLITNYYCFACIETAKKDIYRPIHELGVDGRTLVYKEGFEKIMERIVDTLVGILKIIIKNKKFRNIKKDYVAQELFSIRDWENHKNKKIKKKINEAIKKYNLKLTKRF